MTENLDEQIQALLQKANDEAPSPTTINHSLAEAVATQAPAKKSPRRYAIPVFVAFALFAVGAFFVIDTEEPVRVGTDSTSTLSPATTQMNGDTDQRVSSGDFGMPAVFDRTRTSDDVLPDVIAATVAQEPFKGRDGTVVLDPDRSRRGISSEDVNVWVVPAVDDRGVCQFLEHQGRFAGSTCDEFTQRDVFGVLGGSTGTPSLTITAGVIMNDEIVGVVGAEIRDGVYLAVGPGIGQNDELPQPEFRFADGTTGTELDALGALGEICMSLKSQFFSGPRDVARSEILALEILAQRTRTPSVRALVNALIEVADTSSTDLPVSSLLWSDAVPEGFSMCSNIFGMEVAVRGDTLGPEPDDVIEGPEGFVLEIGLVPAQGGLSGPDVIGRRDGDCLIVELGADFVREPTTTIIELGCGIGSYSVVINTSQGKQRLTGAVLPEDTSVVRIELDGSGREFPMRPVDRVVLSITPGTEPRFITAFRSDGSPIELP